MEEEEKKALFEALYAEDIESEGEAEDMTVFESIKLPEARHRSSNKVRREGVSHKMKGDVSVEFSVERNFKQPSQPIVSAPVPKAVSFPSSTKPKMLSPNARGLSKSNRAKPDAIIDLTKEEAMPKGKKTSFKSGGKRKRGQSLNVVPESLQIFKDLLFYFIPNSDIAEPRRRRIAKATEHGAVRSTELTDAVTHIIVDKNLDYAEVLRILKTDSVEAKTTAILVNEDYPAYCIQWNYLDKPDFSHYRVRGHKEALRLQSERKLAETKAAGSSDDSLQLKPEKHILDSEQTASRTDSSDLPRPSENDRSPAPNSDQHDRNSPNTAPQYAHDALSEAIEETRVTKDLVPCMHNVPKCMLM